MSRDARRTYAPVAAAFGCQRVREVSIEQPEVEPAILVCDQAVGSGTAGFGAICLPSYRRIERSTCDDRAREPINGEQSASCATPRLAASSSSLMVVIDRLPSARLVVHSVYERE